MSTPLSTLLSQLLVAFTIEFDNEFERRIPHRTTMDGGRGPWLVSMVMWSNFLRHLPANGAAVADIEDLIGLVNFGGLQRWRYVELEGARPNPKPRPEQRLRPTRVGRYAQEIWAPLTGEIEQRWTQRFGSDTIGDLRTVLLSVLTELPPNLPQYPPVLGFGNGLRLNARPLATLQPRPDSAADELPAQLSRVLLAFALDYEHESDWSLTLAANQLRVLAAEAMAARDLAGRCGVSPEVTTAQLKFMAAHGLVTIAGQPKRITLTTKGIEAQRQHDERLRAIENRWRDRFGETTIAELRSTLDGILDQQLSVGLQPHPDGWRARGPYAARTAALLENPRELLPHHPVISHRGGFPDGS